MSKRKKFWSGYGESLDIPKPFQGAMKPSPVGQKFATQLVRLLRLLLISVSLLAIVLPENSQALWPFMNDWVQLMKKIVPYISWIEINSNVPNLASVWYALVWPLAFLFLGYFVAFFPYSVASTMAKGMSSAWRHLLVASGGLLLSWMAYGAFFAKFAGTNKASAAGHGRLIEVFAIDSRIGLAIGGTLLVAACLTVWMMTFTVCIAFAARFFHINQ